MQIRGVNQLLNAQIEHSFTGDVQQIRGKVGSDVRETFRIITTEKGLQ